MIRRFVEKVSLGFMINHLIVKTFTNVSVHAQTIENVTADVYTL